MKDEITYEITYEFTAELNLEKVINGSREVAQALNEFADNLERIKKKYVEPESEVRDAEAIELLRYNSNVIHKTRNGETDPREVKALDMAIKALEKDPKTIQEKINALKSIIQESEEFGIAKALEQEPCKDMEEIREVMGCDADAETKCKMISNILTAKPHYFEKQAPCEDAITIEMAESYERGLRAKCNFIDEGNGIKPRSCANCKNLDKWTPIDKNCPCQYCNRKLLNKWEGKDYGN